jgi:Xaa-Pro aminopeptidase
MPVEIAQTWDDRRLKRDRLARVQAEMRKRGVGALYVSDNPTIRYLLAVKVPSARAFVPAEGDVVAFIRPRDAGYVRMVHPLIQDPLYDSSSNWGPEGGAGEGSPDRLAYGLIDLMTEHGVAGSPLGVDSLDVPALGALQRAGINMTYAQPIIEYARAIKTDDEVAIYRAMGHQYAHAVGAFRQAIRPGISENELAGVVVSSWYEAGGEEVAQLNVCAGENMNPWRRWPTQRTVRDGEFVGVDLHGYGFHGLRGDGSRTFFMGDSPSPDQRDLYRRAHDYLLGSMDAFQAGRSYADAMGRVPTVPEKYREQLYNYHIAHAIGMSHSGYPEVNARKPPLDDNLVANQVLSIECYFGEIGNPLAVKLEEQIVVRDGPPEVIGPEIPFDERFI